MQAPCLRDVISVIFAKYYKLVTIEQNEYKSAMDQEVKQLKAEVA